MNFLAKSESPMNWAGIYQARSLAQFIGLSLLAVKFISARPQGLTNSPAASLICGWNRQITDQLTRYIHFEERPNLLPPWSRIPEHRLESCEPIADWFWGIVP
jgi:hypothetical protein